jgi:hypothetical protein
MIPDHIEEIAQSLPNGFHDAQITSIILDYLETKNYARVVINELVPCLAPISSTTAHCQWLK